MFNVNEWLYLTIYYIDAFREEVSYTLMDFFLGNDQAKILLDRFYITDAIDFYFDQWLFLWAAFVKNTLQTEDGRRYSWMIYKTMKIYEYAWGFRMMAGWFPYINPYTGVMAFFSFILEWLMRPIQMLQPNIPFLDFSYWFTGIVLSFLESVAFFFVMLAHADVQ